MDDIAPKDFVIKNKRILEELSRGLEALSKDTDLEEPYRAAAAAEVALIDAFLLSPEKYSAVSAIAFFRVGNEFINMAPLAADNRKQQRLRAIRRVALAGLRVAMEKIIRTGEVSVDAELPILRLLFNRSLPLGDEGVLEPIWNMLQLRDILTEDVKESLGQTKEAQVRIDAATKVIQEWDGRLSDYDKRVKDLLESYNFIGFTKAFSEMRKEVERSRSATRLLLWGIAIAALTPAVVLAGVVLFFDAKALPQLLLDTNQRIFVLLPSVLTFEVLCIYFFRVVLRSFQSASAQVSQLSLRMAACAFSRCGRPVTAYDFRRNMSASSMRCAREAAGSFLIDEEGICERRSSDDLGC